MLWRDAGHDRPLYLINAVLTTCSMVLSGYFGWVIGEGAFPLNVVLAALCAAVAFSVSTMFERGAVFSSLGMSGRAMNCWVVGVLFAGANILFDYSSAAAVREAVMVASANQNNVADTRKSEVARIEERINTIKGQVAWKTPFEAPATYEATITNLEGDGTIMKRSKGCTDQTIEETRKHCQRIADAKAHLANAKEREKLDKELASLDAQLVRAKDASIGTEQKANPALAQVKAISAWFTGERSLNEKTQFWGGNSIMLLMTVLVNCGLVYLGNEIGHVRALKMRDEPEPVRYNAPRLAGAGPGQTYHAHQEPIPLMPDPAPAANYVVINGVRQQSTAGTDQLIALAMEAMKKYEDSPFAKQNGRA